MGSTNGDTSWRLLSLSWHWAQAGVSFGQRPVQSSHQFRGRSEWNFNRFGMVGMVGKLLRAPKKKHRSNISWLTWECANLHNEVGCIQETNSPATHVWPSWLTAHGRIHFKVVTTLVVSNAWAQCWVRGEWKQNITLCLLRRWWHASTGCSATSARTRLYRGIELVQRSIGFYATAVFK